MVSPIRSIRTQRFEIALKRPIRMSFGEIGRQHLMLVRIVDEDGVEGVGEACVMGGPYWNCETIEGAQAVVTRYASPHLLGRGFDGLHAFSAVLWKLFRGNGAARCALEMAYLDLLGKKAGQPAVQLLGGAVRQRIPVAWTLRSGALADALEDGEEAIRERGHRMFKLKVGIAEPASEIAFAAALVERFQGRARILVDANQAWTQDAAREILPRLADAGVCAVEQPVAAHDVLAMARLVRDGALAVIADEPLTDPGVATMFAAAGAASGFSLKPQRDGGLCSSLQMAAIAKAHGISCYGGTMLETSLGTAALCALYAVVPDLQWGCELLGPLRLDGDIVAVPLHPQDGDYSVPSGPGLGVTLDEERIDYLVRKSA